MTLKCSRVACVSASWARRSILFSGSVKSLDDDNDDDDDDDDLGYFDKRAWASASSRGCPAGFSPALDPYRAMMRSPSNEDLTLPQAAAFGRRLSSNQDVAQDAIEVCGGYPQNVRAVAGGSTDECDDICHDIAGAVRRISIVTSSCPKPALEIALPRHPKSATLAEDIWREKVGRGQASPVRPVVLGLDRLGRCWRQHCSNPALGAVVSPRHRSLTLSRCQE